MPTLVHRPHLDPFGAELESVSTASCSASTVTKIGSEWSRISTTSFAAAMSAARCDWFTIDGVEGTSMPPHPPTRLDVMQLPPVLQPATMHDLHSILGGMGPASLQGLQNVLGGAPPPNMSMSAGGVPMHLGGS